MREAHYWLRLLVKAGIVPAERLNPLVDESDQLRAVLSTSVVTAKTKAKPVASTGVGSSPAV